MGWIVNNGVSMIDCRWNLKKESFEYKFNCKLFIE